MTEQWRPIPGFEGRYEVSDLGRVRSLVRGGFYAGPRRHPYILKPQAAKDGYLMIALTANSGVRILRTIHRTVLITFVGPAPEGMVACHGDGNRVNNSASNLRWDTPAANCADKVQHGTLLRGEALFHSKLTEADVMEIHSLLAAGEGVVALGKRYGVRHTTIVAIRKGVTWSWLTGRVEA